MDKGERDRERKRESVKENRQLYWDNVCQSAI